MELIQSESMSTVLWCIMKWAEWFLFNFLGFFYRWRGMRLIGKCFSALIWFLRPWEGFLNDWELQKQNDLVARVSKERIFSFFSLFFKNSLILTRLISFLWLCSLNFLSSLSHFHLSPILNYITSDKKILSSRQKWLKVNFTK